LRNGEGLDFAPIAADIHQERDAKGKDLILLVLKSNQVLAFPDGVEAFIPVGQAAPAALISVGGTLLS
jgi:hypothetical protein